MRGTPFLSTFPIERKGQGYVALLAMLLIAFFGVLAGMHSLEVISLTDATRGVDDRLDRQQLDDRLELVVSESLTRMWETRHDIVPDLQSSLVRHLELLQVPGLQSQVVDISSWAGFPGELLGGGGGSMSLATPSEAFLSLAGPDLRRRIGGLVGELPQGAVVFRTAPLEGKPATETRVGYRFVSVPVVQMPVQPYILPDELGGRRFVSSVVMGNGQGSGSSGIPLNGILVPDETALPYRYRRLACLSSAYAGVFSNAFVSRAVHAAGPGLVHRLDLEPSTTADIAGLTRQGGLCSLDLGLAGAGTFEGGRSEGRLLVFASAASGAELTIGQTSQLGSSALVLLVIGPPKGSLVLKLGSCSRPVLLIAMHATLEPLGGDWAGGLLLGPDCRVADTGQVMRVAHLSHAASGVPIPAGIFRPALKLSAELARLSPRVGYVVTEVLGHEL